MFKKYIIKYMTYLFCLSIGLLLCTFISAPVALAAGPQLPVLDTPAATTPTVTLTQPGVSGQPIGHPGTPVNVAGKGFTAGSSVNIYTVTDPAQCMGGGSGLLPFTASTPQNAQDGTFQFTSPWPANAKNPTTAYYICAINGAKPDEKAVSTASFTVAQPVTVTLSTTNIDPGKQVTVTGDNWLPPQDLTVAITPNQATGQANTFASQNVTSDANGHFSVTLTLDGNTPPGRYAVSVIATNEPTLKYLKDNALKVNAPATPTPTPTAAPSPTATAAATPTPTSKPVTTGPGTSGGGTPAGGQTSTSGTTILIFVLGGLGVLLVIIGIIMFAAAPPARSG